MNEILGQIGILLTLLQWLHSIGAGRSQPSEPTTIRDYLEWLRRHNHQELVAALEASQEAQAQLDQLIREKHDTLMQMGVGIMDAMTNNHQVLLNEFGEAKAILHKICENVTVSQEEDAPLSKEAEEILRTAVLNKTDIWVIDEMGITTVHIQPPDGEKINFDGDFYVEAASELADRNFIRHRKGLVWAPTRAGYAYVGSTESTP